MLEYLPEFPDFRLFTIDDIAWYEDYYIRHSLAPYADISPCDLFVWLNYHDDLKVCKLEDGIVFCYTNVLENNTTNVMPLINPLTDSAIERMMSYLKDCDLPAELHEVPSVICESLDCYKWQIDDDRNSYEYILDTNQQKAMEGKGFSRQRRRMSYFEREHMNDDIDIRYLKEIDGQTKDDLIRFVDSMSFNSIAESTKQSSDEPAAIRINLNYAGIFNKEALVIRKNGEIMSFAIISRLDSDTAAINHLKVDYSVQYIFQYTIYQLAKILSEDGICEMNIEQDLGIDGIRIFKERLRPSRFLEKKIIRSHHQ